VEKKKVANLVKFNHWGKPKIVLQPWVGAAALSTREHKEAQNDGKLIERER